IARNSATDPASAFGGGVRNTSAAILYNTTGGHNRIGVGAASSGFMVAGPEFDQVGRKTSPIDHSSVTWKTTADRPTRSSCCREVQHLTGATTLMRHPAISAGDCATARGKSVPTSSKRFALAPLLRPKSEGVLAGGADLAIGQLFPARLPRGGTS
ncbi:MAG: hypothetical protein M3Q46_12700, partial [Verrucomicrobiota bacterium]|nr:hypothetical protein [Verrucomicrobiota bacterium]